MLKFHRKKFSLGVGIGMAGYLFFTLAIQFSQSFAEEKPSSNVFTAESILTVDKVIEQVTPVFEERYQGFLQEVGVYDFVTDSSIHKFVNKYVGFEEMGYIPSDLVRIDSEYVSVDNRGHKLREEAAEALYTMAEAFYAEFGTPIRVLSSYRSYSYQQGLFAGGGSTAENFIAPAGHSEHQGGLAIDIFLVDTKSAFFANTEFTSYYEWLWLHAHEYGFHNSYQKGVEIDSYHEEPWHRRYLGKKLATELKQRNMTFAEYYRRRVGE